MKDVEARNLVNALIGINNTLKKINDSLEKVNNSIISK